MAESRPVFRDEATVLAFKLAAAMARTTPAPLLEASVPGLGLVFGRTMRDERRTVERHQRRARDPRISFLALKRATHDAFESYARYWIESFRISSLSDAEIRRRFTLECWEYVEAGLSAGGGVVVSLPHLGNWEWAGRWLAAKGIPLTVVVEPVEPPELFEWFRDLRTKFGMTVVPLGPAVTSSVMKALKQNEVVCLMSDRDITGDGQRVSFFDEVTTLPAGPATLALRTGAPLIPVGAYMGPKGSHHALIRPPIDCTRSGEGLRADVARVTQVLAHELEALIRRAPEQWHLFQPNWPSDPGYRFAST